MNQFKQLIESQIKPLSGLLEALETKLMDFK